MLTETIIVVQFSSYTVILIILLIILEKICLSKIHSVLTITVVDQPEQNLKIQLHKI